jgi:hypothetical protein
VGARARGAYVVDMAQHASERAGSIAGYAMAPITAALSRIRRARMFHPTGLLYEAEVHPAATHGSYAELGARLEGSALMRLSSAWWKHREWRDVLGCAIRFSDGDPARDQDLLFATIKHPWTMPFAPLTTHHHDFLDNHYYAVSPFKSDAGLIDLRLSPERAGGDGDTRADKLARAVAAGSAAFVLEARPHHLDARHHPARPIARIELTRAAEGIDQERLRFDPFKNGRGIAPVGFVHSLRLGTYRASQRARPDHATSVA